MLCVHREPLTDPLSVNDAYFRAGFQWFQQSQGQLSIGQDILDDGLMDVLQIQLPKPGGETPYLFVGENSSIAEFYGKHWAANAIGHPGVPDSAYESAMNGDYRGVHQSKNPVLQRCCSQMRVFGTTYFVEWNRMIFPVQFAGVNAVGILTRLDAPPVLLN